YVLGDYNGLVNSWLTTIVLLTAAAYDVSVVTLFRHADIRPTPSVSNKQRFWKPLAGAALVPNHLPLLTEGRDARLGYRGHRHEQTFRSRAGHVGHVADENSGACADGGLSRQSAV